jgi:hypothetical protein
MGFKPIISINTHISTTIYNIYLLFKQINGVGHPQHHQLCIAQNIFTECRRRTTNRFCHFKILKTFTLYSTPIYKVNKVKQG